MGKKTKWIIFTIAVMWGMPIVLRSQQTENKQNWAERGIRLREVEIKAKRPMKDIGVQKTVFDSLVLKENIALSMADVLTFNSSIFVKNYGRATLSTVSFRGTSASHTQVTWNGMRINSPMLGMTDFSTIPSYFIDDASLLHGTSSVNMVGGGLGGLVQLSTIPADQQGFGMQYVQGVGSYRTFDEFLRMETSIGRYRPVRSISLHLMILSSATAIRKRISMMIIIRLFHNIIRSNVIIMRHLRTYIFCKRRTTTQVRVTVSD